MGILARCTGCHRSFDLPQELAVQGRLCQYCGAVLDMPPQTAAKTDGPSPAGPEPILCKCPICDQEVKIRPGPDPEPCSRCDSPLLAPAAPRLAARIQVAAPPSSSPPFTILCVRCEKGRGQIPPDVKGPHVRCPECQHELTPAYMPLEKWLALEGFVTPGTLTETLLLLLRARWNGGAVTAGEIARHVDDLRRITAWLQAKPAERKTDFPLPASTTGEALRSVVFAGSGGEIQTSGSDRCVLALPVKSADGTAPTKAALIITIGGVADGSLFGFLARDDGGETTPLADAQIAVVKEKIAALAPKACFRCLTFRFLYGEWIRPATMAKIPAACVARELHALALPEPKVKLLLERMCS